MSKKTVFSLSLLLVITLLTYFRWFLFSPAAGGDWHYYNHTALRDAFMHYSWVSSYNLGAVDFFLWRLPIDIFKSLLGTIGLDSSISDKLFVFFPSVILGDFAAFFLVKKIFKSNLAGLIGGVVFNFNTYFITANSAYLIYGATSWAIFGLLSFISALETKKIKYSFLSAFLLFLSGGYDFRVAYIGAFLYFSYFIFYSLLIDKKNIKKNLLLLITTGISFGMLNFYWVVTFLKLGSLSSNPILDRTLFGNEFLNILYSISFYHPFWTGSEPVYFISQQIKFYFWLIPVMSFAGLYLNRKNKNVLFFGAIALLGIFLTKQVGVPFTDIYPFLFKHFPGFNAFREASKFYFLIALGYAVLIGGFVYWLYKLKAKSTFKKFAKIFLILLVFLVFLWNIKPVITGEISGIYPDRKIPSSYSNVSNIIENDNSYFRVLWTPLHPKWFFYSNLHPTIGLQNLFDFDWRSLSDSKPGVYRSTGELMKDTFKKEFANNLLDISSIKYIIVPYSDPEGDINVFVNYGEKREYYIKELNKISYLHKIDAGVDDIEIYENYNFRPHLYLTNRKDSIFQIQKYKNISFTFINPTEYKINLHNVNKSIYLNFSESYHPQWKIRIGEFSLIDSLTRNNYFISDKYHLKTDANLNSFYIDPKVVCDLQVCTVNEDGGYDLNITLFFAPQGYMYFGLAVSGVLTILLGGYLIVNFSNKIWRK